MATRAAVAGRTAVAGRAAVAGRSLLSRLQNYIVDNRNLAGANFTDVSTTRLGGQSDPFGGVQAMRLSETAVATGHLFYNSGSLIVPPVAGSAPWFAAAVFMKAGTRVNGGIYLDGGGIYQVFATWDLTTGANTQLTATLGATTAVARTEDVPGAAGADWRRYTVAFQSPAPLNFFVQCFVTNGAAFAGYLGDPTMNAFFYAPGFAFANWAGERTDTTAAIITTPIRNLVANGS